MSKIPLIGIKKPAKKFFYQLGKYQFTVEDVKHGILRGNKRPGFKADFSTLSDERTKFIQPLDLRVLVLFREENSSFINMHYFSPDQFNEELNKVCKTFLSVNVNYSIMDELNIHKLFKLYKSDFNNDTQV